MTESIKTDQTEVKDEVILELKSVKTVLSVHEAQLLTYLRLAGKQVGLIINFNVPILKAGIHRHILSDEGSMELL